MFKRNHKVENLTAKVTNRDRLIDKLVNRVDELKQENLTVYEENKALRYENEELNERLNRIEKLATCNTYKNEKSILNKIREVISNHT